MKDFKPKKADAILSKGRELPQVFAKIQQLDILNRLVADHLEVNMRQYCKVAHLTSGRLTLVVANGSIATQLRFQTSDLIKRFANVPALKYVKEIHCKVHPSITETARTASRPTARQQRQMSLLSTETAEIIQSMADSLEDPHLRAVMQRIAAKKK
ncbi:MAG: DciA family protein [Gammaproteobacteria bacterium]